MLKRSISLHGRDGGLWIADLDASADTRKRLPQFEQRFLLLWTRGFTNHVHYVSSKLAKFYSADVFDLFEQG